MDDFRVGRVLLVGGMGLNGGINDAFNLVENLVGVWHGADLTLLDRYSRQRRPVVQSAILQQADQNRQRMTQKDPEARACSLRQMRKIASTPELAGEYLLKSSMIYGLRRAAAIA